MTDPLSDRHERWLVRLLQFGLLVISAYGLYRGKISIVVNGLVSFGVTLVPMLLRRDAGISLAPSYVLWISIAVFVHAVGLLGPYQNLPWYDSIAHALSAFIVAGAGYATVKAIQRNSDRTTLTPSVEFVIVLIVVLAFGVLWEILEFGASVAAETLGGKAVLIQYGLDDVIHDTVFNFLGGLVVAGVDTVRPKEAADEAAEAMDD